MKYLFSICLMLVVLGSCTDLQAAETKFTIVTGRLVDKQNNALDLATVIFVGTSYGAVVGLNGYFQIPNVPYGEYTIRVNSLGYKTFQKEFRITDSTNMLQIKVEEDDYILPQLTIVGKRDRLFTSIPGSVWVVDSREMRQIQPISGNEVFRRIPGLHVVDEEGVGMRANIGIRGLDPDRSRSVLVLEDGIPVALNPYGEPELYYTPAIDRMSGVEVLKGSGQILYGPQTVGGVVNYITANAPTKQEIGLKIRGGQGGFFSGILSYGNTFDNVGVQVTYLKKRADQIGVAGFNIDDFTTKISFATGKKGVLALKLGAYRETSNSTYIGITQSMFDRGGDDFSILAPSDQLNVNRYSVSANHSQELSKTLKLQSTFFAYSTTRNWRRQDFALSNSNGTLPSNWSGKVWGDESVAGGAIYMRNSTGNRDRQFEVAGLEQKLIKTSQIAGKQNELTVGYRLMHEKAYEQTVNGTKPDAVSGALVAEEERTGKALSVYAHNKIKITNKLDVSLGVRGEFYNYEREIFRNSNIDTFMVARNTIAEVIPGIGFNWKASTYNSIFGGVHRGYAPPRVKDAIDFRNDNPVLQLDAERSWNYELGIRSMVRKGLYVEATGFYMDFENQIIPISESIGGIGFGVTNAGRTIHSGIEGMISLNTKEMFKTKWNIELNANASYIQAVYAADRMLMQSGQEVNVKGNRTPYSPQIISSAALTVETPFKTGLRVTNTYVGKQFTDELNTIAPSTNGRIGQLAAYNVIDLSLYQELKKHNIRFNISVKNLTNERYIASRRPQGIRVGLNRFISAGIDWTF